MSKTRIAINGFGRIGRNAFKVAFENDDLEVVAINDLTDNETLAHLLRFDTNYGRYAHPVTVVSDDALKIGETNITVVSEREPAKLPWKDLEIDIVIECTGFFTKPEMAMDHIKAGARRVVISAPAKGDGASTHVLGVRDASEADSEILSNASCTTNCISPPAAIMVEYFGVEKAMMTTIHSYTADQNLQDGPHKDLRRARAAALNIVPTTTGATKATAQVVPEMEGIFDGMAIRVPTPVGSLSDFTFLLKRDTTVEEINQVFIDAASQDHWQGILAVTDEPVVSSDIVGDSHSSIIDLSLTQVTGGNMAKIVAWYDNEWGYSNRLVELVVDAGRLLKSKD